MLKNSPGDKQDPRNLEISVCIRKHADKSADNFMGKFWKPQKSAVFVLNRAVFNTRRFLYTHFFTIIVLLCDCSLMSGYGTMRISEVVSNGH